MATFGAAKLLLSHFVLQHFETAVKFLTVASLDARMEGDEWKAKTLSTVN